MLLRANGWMINFNEEFPFALRRPLLLGPSRSAASKIVDSPVRGYDRLGMGSVPRPTDLVCKPLRGHDEARRALGAAHACTPASHGGGGGEQAGERGERQDHGARFLPLGTLADAYQRQDARHLVAILVDLAEVEVGR
jgi:hypothetical protein